MISFLQAAEHEMIDNHIIKEEKPSFPVTNALVAPMGNPSTRSQQLHQIIEDPSYTNSVTLETPKVYDVGQQRFNVQMIEDHDCASTASGHPPYVPTSGQGNDYQALFSMLTYSYNAFVAKNIIHTRVVQENLEQIDADELEDMDLK